ncbi:MAG: ABC transporter substrate-binding protein [Proteobacteria bacterium SG_bin9]|nr:MAG: ABC transporter substrate-binding protein [Proteobacteria bacterium SG_bin9]
MPGRFVCLVAALAVAGMTGAQARDDYPNRPITWVVPFTPGGITDTNARLVADELSKVLGQSVVVDNRGGAGGTIGTEQVARAAPDGYTMVYATQGTMAANVSLRKALPYDPLKNFVPVHVVAETPNILAASPTAPFSTLDELVAYAKKHPGKITYGSSGAGTATHLVAELFKAVAGVEIMHIPYKGSAPAMTDLLGGRIDIMFDYPVTVGPHADAGKLKLLATTAASRLAVMPKVPTMAELGFKDLITESWSGVMVPAGTPDAVVDRLAAAVRVAITSDRVREQLDKFGSRAVLLQKGDMRSLIEREIVRWADVIAKSGIEKQ